MKKKTGYSENRVGKTHKRQISFHFLLSYLLILLAPAIAVVAVYFMAENALVETQQERIQNMLSEARLTLDREVEQAQNVGYYVSREKRLCDYLSAGTPVNKTEEFYSLYTVATNYPNYSLTNQFVKNVYVLFAEGRYLIKVPQVIPETERGVATLAEFPFSSYEVFMEYYGKQDKSQTLFQCEGRTGEQILFLPCQLTYPYSRPGKSVIIVQLDWNRIKQLLTSVLAKKNGIVALVDSEENILISCQNTTGGDLTG